MIFIFSPTSYEGTKFAMEAKLREQPVRICTNELALNGMKFIEDDEVFVLDICSPDFKRAVRVIHDSGWPRPHIYKEVKSRVRS